MAVRTSGWKITIAPDWSAVDDEPREKDGRSPIALVTLDGSAASPQLREAEAVVLATFGYVAKTEATIRLSTQRWQRPWEWLTGGLLMSAYISLHAAETNRILLLGSDQLTALLPTIRQRAVKYLPAGDPRLTAFQGLPDPTEPTHQALARVQSKLVQAVTAAQPAPQVAPATEKHEPGIQAAGADPTSSEASPHAPALAEPGQVPPDPGPGGPGGPGGGNGANGGPPNGPTGPDTNLVTLTGMLGRDQRIAAMAMGEATRAEDQQQAQVRRFRGVLLGTFLGLLIAVALLAILGSAHPGYFPLCVQKQATTGGTTVCPTGGSNPSKADLAFIMAIGGIGAVLAVAANLTSLKPTGVRYSLSVAQGLIKIPFGAITAMLGIIIVSTQSNIGVLATHAGLISTAVVFGYSQQIFTKLIDKRADDLLNQAGGN